MAIQNLRDKLLKAGVVDKKQKQQADTQDRRDKKQKTADQLAVEEAERQQAFALQKATEAELARQREAERAEHRQRHEALNRVRNICDRWAVRPLRAGSRRFHFVQRSGRIGHLMVTDAHFDQLLLGALAVVERLPPEEISPPLCEVLAAKPRKKSVLSDLLRLKDGLALGLGSTETHVLLPPDAAERVALIDPTALRFWAHSGKPVGFVADLAS